MINQISSKQTSFALILFFIGIIGVVCQYCAGGLFPGDPGDARFNLYVFEHFYLALNGQVQSFVDADFFYPLSKTILFSENHFATAWIYSYFRSIGVLPMDAFFCWFLLGFILNYWSSFYVFDKLKLSQLAASIAAFLFTFGLPLIAQDGHAQLFYRPFVPLAFFALYQYFSSRNFYYLALSFLFWSLQIFISVYNGIFLLYLLLAFVAVEFWKAPKNSLHNFLHFNFC